MSESERPIPSAPGYFATDRGEIVSQKRGRRTALKQFKINNLLAVSLRIERRGTTRSVARLTAEAWIGPSPKGFDVHHRDGNRHNVAAANLFWGPPADKGDGNRAAKLTESDVKQVLRRLQSRESGSSIGRAFGVSDDVIHRIKYGRGYANVPRPKIVQAE